MKNETTNLQECNVCGGEGVWRMRKLTWKNAMYVVEKVYEE